MKTKILSLVAMLALGFAMVQAQVNSGSNGSDGALDLSATNGTIFIDMADHPNGVYQYTSVNIPAGAVIRFIPNANNTPVVWLVQSNVIINGAVDVSGQSPYCPSCADAGSAGGPGGWAGGNGGTTATAGSGPGGGSAGSFAGNGSFGTVGGCSTNSNPVQSAPGASYGNVFLCRCLAALAVVDAYPAALAGEVVALY